MKCGLSIARVEGGDSDGAVRITAHVGPLLLARIEVSFENFALALFGRAQVPATFASKRSAKPENG